MSFILSQVWINHTCLSKVIVWSTVYNLHAFPLSCFIYQISQNLQFKFQRSAASQLSANNYLKCARVNCFSTSSNNLKTFMVERNYSCYKCFIQYRILRTEMVGHIKPPLACALIATLRVTTFLLLNFLNCIQNIDFSKSKYCV